MVKHVDLTTYLMKLLKILTMNLKELYNRVKNEEISPTNWKTGRLILILYSICQVHPCLQGIQAGCRCYLTCTDTLNIGGGSQL